MVRAGGSGSGNGRHHADAAAMYDGGIPPPGAAPGKFTAGEADVADCRTALHAGLARGVAGIHENGMAPVSSPPPKETAAACFYRIPSIPF